MNTYKSNKWYNDLYYASHLTKGIISTIDQPSNIYFAQSVQGNQPTLLCYIMEKSSIISTKHRLTDE